MHAERHVVAKVGRILADSGGFGRGAAGEGGCGRDHGAGAREP